MRPYTETELAHLGQRPQLDDRQRKALAWILECQIEKTAENAPHYKGDQAAEEVQDLTTVAELLGDKRLIDLCRSLLVEAEQRQLRADSAELARIRAWAKDQSDRMDAEPNPRPPEGDDWNDLYAQVMP